MMIDPAKHFGCSDWQTMSEEIIIFAKCYFMKKVSQGGGDEVEQGIVTMATVCDGVISAHNIRRPNEGWSNVPTTDMV